MSTTTNTSLAKRRTAVRRGIIAALVALCLLLFTVYFRESTGGALHGLQNGAATAVAPVESVVVRAVQPFRDAWDWTAGLVHARGRAERLQTQVDVLRSQMVNNSVRAATAADLKALTGIPVDPSDGYRKVYATVLAGSPSNWYARARLDAGTADGVIKNSPVVAAGRRSPVLVGLITAAGGHQSTVTYITESHFQAGATVLGAGNPPGIVRGSTPGTLSLDWVPRDFGVRIGQWVVTSGKGPPRLPSVYPPGLFIGQVTNVGIGADDQFQSIQVNPEVDTRQLAHVVVMAPTSERALRRARSG